MAPVLAVAPIQSLSVADPLRALDRCHRCPRRRCEIILTTQTITTMIRTGQPPKMAGPLDEADRVHQGKGI